MAKQTFVYNKFLEISVEGTNNFSSHEYYVALMKTTYMPDIDVDESWSDISTHEVTPGTGYSANGKKLSGITITRNDVENAVTVSWSSCSWNIPEGVSLSNIKGCIIYNNTLASKPLIAFYEFESALDVPQLNSFVVSPIIKFENGGI